MSVTAISRSFHFLGFGVVLKCFTALQRHELRVGPESPHRQDEDDEADEVGGGPQALHGKHLALHCFILAFTSCGIIPGIYRHHTYK